MKVDAGALPPDLVNAVRRGAVNLDDPATTLALLKLDAVVGVKGVFGADGKLTSVGILCALCHSTVDQSFSTNAIPPGNIGKRLDGWPVGHLGYTTVGLGLMTQTAMAASVLYIFHHILVITNLYLISGIFLRLRRTTEFSALGSILREYPWVAAISVIPLFSLAGVPPLSGFIGKLALIRATLAAGAWWTSAIILVVGVLTMISMARLWDESFWKPSSEPDKSDMSWVMLLPIAGLAAITLAITVAAEPLFRLTLRASEQLLNPQVYIDAVLKGEHRQ